MKKNYQTPAMTIMQFQCSSTLLSNSVTSVDDGGSDTGIEYGGGGHEPARVHGQGEWGDIWD